MRIAHILIENFGIYRNLCEFNFDYDDFKKVTLLKGENGSGKTTLLNSIKTVLYGPMLMGSQKQNNIKYMTFIDRMLNTEARKDPFSRYSIDVEMTANLQQFSGRFRIIRSWNWVNKKIKEELNIYNEDHLMSEQEIDDFFKIFYRLYPLELFELFYLDGEKIDQLSFFDSNIHKLIESTMNIDLFKTLKSDLETYAIKKHKTKELESLKKDKDYSLSLLEHLEEKVRLSEEQLIQLEDEDVETAKRVDQLTQEISQFNQNLPEQIQSKNSQIKDIKKDLTKHMIETIPLLLLKSEIAEVTSQLTEEADNSKSKIIRDSLNDDLRSKILNAKQEELPIEHIDQIFTLIKDQFVPNDSVIHGISSDEYQELSVFVSRINSETGDIIKNLFDEYHALIKEVKVLNNGMESYDANKINSLLEDLLTVKAKSQQILNDSLQIKEQIKTDQMQIASVQSKIDGLESEIWKALKSENINNVITRMKTVIETYVTNMKRKKIESIQEYTKNMFESLVRKKGFIRKVTIDEDHIFLTTGEGNKLLVNSLSSGEKQLFVLSVIYALVKVSERSTPLIFDTLLGRLDKNHQQEVMEKFIANCPDQVIILATDSELENIKSDTLDAIVKTRYSIDLSKQSDRIEMII